MQGLEVSGAVRLIHKSLGVKGLNVVTWNTLPVYVSRSNVKTHVF